MGAYQNIWKSVTGMPAASLAGKQYFLVTLNSDGKLVTPPAAGDPCIGVTQEPNDVDQPTQVAAAGELFVVLGGAVAPGQRVMADAAGKAVAYDHDPTHAPVGICVVGGVADDIGTILRT